jgi:hypothetical protein
MADGAVAARSGEERRCGEAGGHGTGAFQEAPARVARGIARLVVHGNSLPKRRPLNKKARGMRPHFGARNPAKFARNAAADGRGRIAARMARQTEK